MNALFAPAVGLMNRLKYPYKFAVIGIVALVAIAYLLISLTVNLRSTLGQSQRELEGIALVKPMLRYVQAVQQHRGISAGVLGGNAALKEKAGNKAAEIAELVKTVDAAVDAHDAGFGAREEWERVKQEWKDLSNEWPTFTGPANFTAHGSLVEHVLQMIGSIADGSGMVMDPSLDSLYLVNTAVFTMPDTLERLGKIRAAGVGALSRRTATDDERLEFAGRLGVLDKMTSELLANLNRSGRQNPSIKTQLDGFQQKFIGGVVTPGFTEYQGWAPENATFDEETADYSLSESFVKDLAKEMQPGSSAVFIVVLQGNTAALHKRLAEYGGTLLYSNLGDAAAAELEAELEEEEHGASGS
mgnify:CR=1 FL=1